MHSKNFEAFYEIASKLPEFKNVLKAHLQTYLKQIYDNYQVDELKDFSLKEIGISAASLWKTGEKRTDNDLIMKSWSQEGKNKSPFPWDVLEIIQKDRSFLVDSIVSEMAAQGIEALALFHPVVQTDRDLKGNRLDKQSTPSSNTRSVRESFIQIHFSPLDESQQKKLIDSLKKVILDIHYAVDDFLLMRQTMEQSIIELEQSNFKSDKEQLTECIDFLRWLRDDHFAFFGVRAYEFPKHKDSIYDYSNPNLIEGSGQGILRNPEVKVLKRRTTSEKIRTELAQFINEPIQIMIAKSNLPSRIHRRVYMDYVGIKQYDKEGVVKGEIRFVGLFTAEAYEQMAKNVPFIRRKVKRVVQRAGQLPGTHNEKTLQHIVETYPRDELFQIEEDDLLRISLGILHLNDRPRPKLFIRRDRFDRFVSAIVFIPRERYNATLRQSIGELLRQAYGGRLSAFYPKYGDSTLARIHFIIGLDPFDHPEPDVDELETLLIRLCYTWEDKLRDLAKPNKNLEFLETLSCYASAFPIAYREFFETSEALEDLLKITGLGDFPEIAVNVYRKKNDKKTCLRFKLYRRDQKIPLSSIMPIFKNMGLLVMQESGYKLAPIEKEEDVRDLQKENAPKSSANVKNASKLSQALIIKNKQVNSQEDSVLTSKKSIVWIHDFEMFISSEFNFEKIKQVFEEAILAIWTEKNENDGFNALILGLGISWREAAFLRTCSKYRQQTGYDASQLVQEQAMIDNPEIVRLLLQMKTVKFDPSYSKNRKERAQEITKLEAQLKTALNQVKSLDVDRVLRRIGRLIIAMVRTNFYQINSDGNAKPYISIKIKSQKLIDLAEPKPYREIYVSAPNVEGVHIRFGPIARGGLRWSDRRDDFRTEVLGLVKAQQVKNAVIVPVGSKGGFFPKRLPKGASRDEIREEAIRAYKTFISGLLDITDTLDGEKLVSPLNLLSWDQEDPYLVVAADKGTASFSDIANELAREYGFWLDDAFASGGSAGYDHKEMGITARGGWEAVKRHFRELGKDIQKERFTAIGIGDMSGDVFGNGMLLSKKIRLIAAFDHRHIFIDPDPDETTSWQERKRLFEMSRSSWEDYNKTLISKGGGVFSRAEKSIKLTKEIKQLTGLTAHTVMPVELIAAIIRSECELMWFGGIGTYIKAEHEQNWEVSDKANDDLRANAARIKANVIGEGANLGVTQQGRIAFARRGGKINTDAIDNSAGVDSSDHEVNLKILLNMVMRSEKMSMTSRNKLLESMTEDVASHVLRHNYSQTRAISIAEACADKDIDAYSRLMNRLEQEGLLNRVLEHLPSRETIRNMKTNHENLTRPEISVLIAYAKIAVFNGIVDSDVSEDPYFEKFLISYFPKGVHKYQSYMQQHRLKREIIATQLANLIVDLGGANFYHRIQELSGASFSDLTKAFAGSLEVLGIEDLIARVDALDNRVSASIQTKMLLEIEQVLRHQTIWFSKQLTIGGKLQSANVNEMINIYGEQASEIRPKLLDYLSSFDKKRVEKRVSTYIKSGVPKELAIDISVLKASAIVTNITNLSLYRDWQIEDSALLFFKLGAYFRLDKLRYAVSAMFSPHHWDRVALKKLSDDFYIEQTKITSQLMDFVDQEGKALSKEDMNKQNWADESIKHWSMEHQNETKKLFETLDMLEHSGDWSPAKLYLALAELRELSDML